jgi:glycosyltransferase involved in cell wall biosynthesis
LDKLNISLITCAYNSNETILGRLLQSIHRLDFPKNYQVEYLIIDNASSHPIAEQASVKSFIQEVAFPTQVIVEPQPGLTYARICGIKAAKGQFIIFFDDDNEPASDYLTQAIALMEAFPFVGIWGPGSVRAELLGKVPASLENHYRYTFQERSMPFEQYTRTIQGNEAFPLGTGMVLRREVLTPYLQAFEERKYTLTDRIGNSLASSGDTQIVLTAVKNGWAVGNAPQLKNGTYYPCQSYQYSLYETIKLWGK